MSVVPSAKSKVLVAMSGGVDSCVSAALLAEEGHDVVGITMRVVADEEHQSVFQPCCSARMAEDARQVAEKFGFPHYTINLVDAFEDHVINDFTEEYLAGRTPNPCVRCNQRLKFGTLYKKAVELEADYIATGHYVRLARIGGRLCIQKAIHRAKDQSYVMGGLSQRQLGKALFPLGSLTKEETRAKARSFGLAAAETPESQDICFIPDNDYKGFVTRRAGAQAPGPILSASGEQLGEHPGLLGFTVGQRKGLGIAAPRPLYVVRLDAARNAVIIGYEEETFTAEFTTGSVIWSGLPANDEPFACFVQIRYHHEPAACTVTPEGDSLRVEFEAPERSVTPGQWAVFYDAEERVLAAALIEEFTSAESTALTYGAAHQESP